MELKGAYIDSIWDKCKEKMLTKKPSSSSPQNENEEGDPSGLPTNTSTSPDVTPTISNIDLAAGTSLVDIHQQCTNTETTTTVLQEKDDTNFIQEEQTIPLNVELTG